MIGPIRGAGTAIVGLPAAFLLAACTTLGISAEAPKVVTGQPLPPYELQEECVRLGRGDRVDYSFESSEPVDFSIRYLDGNAVVMPVARVRTRTDAGIFVPPMARDYCLAWQAGPAGALLHYRIRMRHGTD